MHHFETGSSNYVARLWNLLIACLFGNRLKPNQQLVSMHDKIDDTLHFVRCCNEAAKWCLTESLEIKQTVALFLSAVQAKSNIDDCSFQLLNIKVILLICRRNAIHTFFTILLSSVPCCVKINQIRCNL